MIFKKSKKGIFNKMLVCTAMLFAGVLASCGGGGNNNSKPQGGDVSTPGSSEVVDNTYAVNWEVDEHATVAVTGYDSLPAKIEKDKTITFTVSLDSGYEIGTVKANKTKLVAKNGSYSTKIVGATTITVTALEQVDKVEVTTKPTKLTYFVGDAVDTTGMVVEVTYKTNRKEAIEKGPEGYAISPATFIGGETSFKVIYGDYEVEVPLAQRVEYKVVIDPNGGTLSDTYLAKLTAFNLNNYDVSDKGVVSFTHFKDLTRPVTLPTKDEITYENHNFLGWGTAATTINNDTTESVYAVAQWQAELVAITEASLAVENDTPYLIVKGTYKLADEVYLYLYEGNKKISLKGDTYTNTGDAGAALEVKFDLNRLVNAKAEDGSSFEGAWMDIRFNASLGEQEESMEIAIASITIDMASKIKQGGHVFTFADYEGKLKVYYNMVHIEYSVRFGAEDGTDGKVDYLYIEGTTASDYYGKAIRVSWFAGSETAPDGSAIDAEGHFVIKVPLTKIPVKTDAFAHVEIISSLTEETPTSLYGGTNTNLAVNSCTTEIPATPDKPLSNSIAYVSEVDGLTTYVGNKWDGLMLYRVDERRSYQVTEVTLEKVDTVVYYVVKGTSKGYTQDELAYHINFQHNSDADGVSWDYVWGETGTPEAEQTFPATLADDGTFVVKVPVSTLLSDLYADNTAPWVLTVHAGPVADEVVSDLKAPIVNRYFSDGKVQYSLRKDGTTWDIASLVMEPATAQKILTEKAEVAVVENKVLLTISGSSMNYTKAELEAMNVYVDFQQNEVYSNWQGNWARFSELERTFTVQEDGTWTLVIDITNLNPYLYTGQLTFGEIPVNDKGEPTPSDMKVPESFETTVECNGKSYKVFEVAGSGNDYECWGCVGIEVATVEAAQ